MIVIGPPPPTLPTASRHTGVAPGAEADVEKAADDEEDDTADGTEDCAEEGC